MGAFTQKTWKDRVTQYINRRLLTDVNTGDTQLVTVARDEGNITEAGDTFTAAIMNDLESRIQAAFDAMHPVGSIYMSVDDTNPSSLFGGTWVAWGAGRVPVGVDTSQTEFDTVEETGGNKTHKHWQTCGSDANYFYDMDNTVAPDSRITKTLRALYDHVGPMSTDNMRQSATYNESSLQPYITCFMWKRVS